MELIDNLLRFWIDAHWTIALVIAFISNTSAYIVSAYCIEKLSEMLLARDVTDWIDNRALKPQQKILEITYGVVSCGIFAILSLLTRQVYSTVWPTSVAELVFQVAAFVLFYETYSYFIHRLLHTRWLIKMHAVHHRSTRTTPWSAYSVHPIEACFIGISAPIFMYILPMSIGVAFVLHFSGMMFTILLHSNILLPRNKLIASLISDPTQNHTKHHQKGNKNFGFVNTAWDRLFKTYD